MIGVSQHFATISISSAGDAQSERVNRIAAASIVLGKVLMRRAWPINFLTTNGKSFEFRKASKSFSYSYSYSSSYSPRQPGGVRRRVRVGVDFPSISRKPLNISPEPHQLIIDVLVAAVDVIDP